MSLSYKSSVDRLEKSRSSTKRSSWKIENWSMNSTIWNDKLFPNTKEKWICSTPTLFNFSKQTNVWQLSCKGVSKMLKVNPHKIFKPLNRNSRKKYRKTFLSTINLMKFKSYTKKVPAGKLTTLMRSKIWKLVMKKLKAHLKILRRSSPIWKNKRIS